MTVQHDRAHSRFVVPLDDGEAELAYSMFGDDIVNLQHTGVPAEDEGQGIADTLVRAALAWARDEKFKVMATCPYVQAWLRNHPEERAAVT